METNRTVLVTGASSGIGKALVLQLAQEGYRVYGTSRHPGDPPADNVTMIQLDVRDDASVKSCVTTVVESEGRLDVLVNNAGYAHRGPLENVTVDEFRDQFETNLYGVHRMTLAAMPQLFKQSSGRIINVSSGIGRLAVPFSATYCSSKFALEGYSEGLAMELKPHGISVILVEPGLTDTEFHANASHTADTDERYRVVIQQMRSGSGDRMQHADTAETVADVIRQAITDEDPKLRYICPAAKARVAMAGPERL